MRGFNYKKAIQSLNFFAQKHNGTLNKMKAIKLIWLADRLHIRRYGRTITGDVYFALPYGPVPSTTRDILEEYGLSDVEKEYSTQFIESISRYEFRSLSEANCKVFSKTDLEVLEEILTGYGNLNEFELSDLSHEFPEWVRYKSALESKTVSRFEIDLNDFFINKEDSTNSFIDSDENLLISKEMMDEMSHGYFS
jgi:uncharacterized phage-associated protein